MKGFFGWQQVPSFRFARVKIVHVISSTILVVGFHFLFVNYDGSGNNRGSRRSDALSKEVVEGDVEMLFKFNQVICAKNSSPLTVVGHRGGRHTQQVCQVLLRYAIV